jgi:hypothetical protein
MIAGIFLIDNVLDHLSDVSYDGHEISIKATYGGCRRPSAISRGLLAGA